MPSAFSSISEPSAESTPLATLGGGIITPVPQWRRGEFVAVCGFDGGTRFSLSVEPLPSFSRTVKIVRSALETHESTRQPVPLWDGVDATLGRGVDATLGRGVCCRGASSDERAYFRDLPQEGAVCLFTDEFRVILRLGVLDGVSCASRNDAVVILGWRAFVQNSSVYAASMRVCEFLRRLGLRVTFDRVNRVDVNVTVDSIPMALIRDAFCGGFFRSRSSGRLFDNRPGILGTLYFGGKESPVMFRAYDKSAELRATVADPDSRDKLRVLRRQFGDESLTRLTRFEFELHRRILRDFGVADFRDLEMKLSAILKHLLGEWLRVTETPYERKASDRHRNRQTVAPWWAFIADSLAAFAASLADGQAVDVKRGSHHRTTGARSRSTADRWAFAAFEEALIVRAESGEDVDADEVLEQFCAAIRAKMLRGELGRGSASGTVSGADLAWNYAVGAFGKE